MAISFDFMLAGKCIAAPASPTTETFDDAAKPVHRPSEMSRGQLLRGVRHVFTDERGDLAHALVFPRYQISIADAHPIPGPPQPPRARRPFVHRERLRHQLELPA